MKGENLSNEPERYLDRGNAHVGMITEVFGFYQKQEWVKVRLVKEVEHDHWRIERYSTFLARTAKQTA